MHANGQAGGGGGTGVHGGYNNGGPGFSGSLGGKGGSGGKESFLGAGKPLAILHTMCSFMASLSVTYPGHTTAL
jgi:hypothetical protein